MYLVIDVNRAHSLDSEHDDFNNALARSEELATEQAREDGIDEELISSFENGDDPRRNPNGEWEAGAGPENDECAYWPHIVWKD